MGDVEGEKRAGKLIWDVGASSFGGRGANGDSLSKRNFALL
jgi:hypothetical protein